MRENLCLGDGPAYPSTAPPATSPSSEEDEGPEDDAPAFGAFIEGHLETVDRFFGSEGPQTLFIYRTTSGQIGRARMQMVTSIKELRDIRLEDSSILYFTRSSSSSAAAGAVEMASIEHDVHCGLLKGNVVENLQFMLSEVFMPLLKVQSNASNQKSRAALLQQLKKSANALTPDAETAIRRTVPLVRIGNC